MHKIMLVDDEIGMVSSMQRGLRAADRQIEAYTDPRKALADLEIGAIDLIVSDYKMPGMNGVNFLAETLRIQPDAIRIIVSGNVDLEFLKDAINRAEIYHFLPKPWNDQELTSVVNKALELHSLRIENKRLVDKVRRQNDHLQQQQSELQRLEALNPGITQVDRDSDGAILLDID